MALDLAPGVQQQDHEAFDIAVKVGMPGDMLAPVGCGFVGRVAQLHFGGCRALAQGQNLNLLGVEQHHRLLPFGRYVERCGLSETFHFDFLPAGPALGRLAVWWSLARSHASHESGESVLVTPLWGDA